MKKKNKKRRRDNISAAASPLTQAANHETLGVNKGPPAGVCHQQKTHAVCPQQKTPDFCPQQQPRPEDVLAAHMAAGWVLQRDQLVPPRNTGGGQSLPPATTQSGAPPHRAATAAATAWHCDDEVRVLSAALGLAVSVGGCAQTQQQGGGGGGGGGGRSTSNGGASSSYVAGGGKQLSLSLPAAALRALVGAVTAARLSGVALQRADWALAALAEAEHQVCACVGVGGSNVGCGTAESGLGAVYPGRGGAPGEGERGEAVHFGYGNKQRTVTCIQLWIWNEAAYRTASPLAANSNEGV